MAQSQEQEEELEQEHWFFQASQQSMQQAEPEEEPVIVRAISGALVASLPAKSSEEALALKKRIQEHEGTAVFMQKLVQEGRILEDRDMVGKEPLVLVRVPRPRILISSLHNDLRAYDLETGAAMRVAPAMSLRISCMIADWESARCFTGSSDGALRAWDVFSCECLGNLLSLKGKVTALASDRKDLLVATSASGSLLTCTVEETGSGQVLAKRSEEFDIKVSGKVSVSVNFEKFVAVVSGESEQAVPLVMAYDLRSGKVLWKWQLAGTTSVLDFDWHSQRCIVAPGHQFLELRRTGASAPTQPVQFAHDRLHHKGMSNGSLVRVDWENARVLFIAEPFALELWSLATMELLYRKNDFSGDNLEIVSLDVDWSQTVPQAITCRTYIDWELVAGEVCVQHWDMEEEGDIKHVAADHPLIGGFDIVAAVAQF